MDLKIIRSFISFSVISFTLLIFGFSSSSVFAAEVTCHKFDDNVCRNRTFPHAACPSGWRLNTCPTPPPNVPEFGLIPGAVAAITSVVAFIALKRRIGKTA